jgi:hypothetical protein
MSTPLTTDNTPMMGRVHHQCYAQGPVVAPPEVNRSQQSCSICEGRESRRLLLVTAKYKSVESSLWSAVLSFAWVRAGLTLTLRGI